MAIAWLATVAEAAEPAIKTSYVPYRFASAENWRMHASGNPGETHWNARAGRLTFRAGPRGWGLVHPTPVCWEIMSFSTD
jgi:hypothetical protein